MATTSTSNLDMLLPEDIIFRILLWLPIPSLLRFKSVCKSWFSLIESSCFITQHLHHLHFPNEENILVITHPPKFHRSACFSISFSLLSGNKFQMSENFNLPLYSCNKGVQIFASCDGIVCIQHDDYKDISLLNPGTKQCKILPRLSVPENKLGEPKTRIICGFGFDVKSNDYKLVRILEVFVGVKLPKLIERQVEIYSLNTNSWTTIEGDNYDAGIIIIGSDLNSPFRNNGIHCWLGRIPFSPDSSGTVHLIASIVSFDFSKCVFENIPLPDVYTVGKFNLKLALLRENIACIHLQTYTGDWSEKYDCNIWVMNEYGVKESWYKLCTMKMDQYNYPMGFTKKGDIICEKGDYREEEAELCLYDPVTQELQFLPVQPFLLDSKNIAVYKESLVSIKSLNDGETNILHFNSSAVCNNKISE